MIILLRFSATDSAQRKLLTAQYCKTELKVLTIFLIYIVVAASFANTVAVILFPNKFHLPYNFYAVFLPFDRPFSLSWALTYGFESVSSVFVIIFFLAYFPKVLFTLNHSSWLLDVTLSEIDDKSIPYDIKRLAELVAKVTIYQITSQRLLLMNFFIEFNFSSIILILAIFSLTISFVGSIPAIISTMVIMIQLFSFCWLGNRVEDRLEQLTAALYNIDWYVLEAKQQKDLMLLMLMTRNIRKFHGIFKRVNLLTCREVSTTRND